MDAETALTGVVISVAWPSLLLVLLYTKTHKKPCAVLTGSTLVTKATRKSRTD
jgi:multisubunit Na+/H+ antiporter MnhC subunit